MLEKKETLNIFEKKECSQFDKIGLLQTLKTWSIKAHRFLKRKWLIKSLIEQKDFATLFELKNRNYDFSESENEKINEGLNNILVKRDYRGKFELIDLIEKNKIEIDNEKYYYFIISNDFNDFLKEVDFLNESGEECDKNKLIICKKLFKLLKDKNFREDFHEFIVKDMENRPRGFNGMSWWLDRVVYQNPQKNSHIFEGISKSRLNRMMNSKIESVNIVNEYRELANKATVDEGFLNELGFDTTSLVKKAQASLFLKEESLTEEMKEKLNKICKSIEKAQNTENKEYQEEIKKITEYILPKVIKKYLSIDEEYRETLKNIEGKCSSELLLESLDNIYSQINKINREINEEKIKYLSIEKRKLKK